MSLFLAELVPWLLTGGDEAHARNRCSGTRDEY